MINTNIRVMCWRFIIFMVSIFMVPVIKKYYETKVAWGNNIARYLKGKCINICSGCHLEVSYVKMILKFN